MFFAAQTHEQKNDNDNFEIAVVFLRVPISREIPRAAIQSPF